MPPNANEQTANRPFRVIPAGKKVGSGRQGPPRDGLGFSIKFPVTINQLGIAKKALQAFALKDQSNNLTVELLDTSNGDVIMEANYTAKGILSLFVIFFSFSLSFFRFGNDSK